MKLNMIKGREVSLFVENAVDSIKDNGFWQETYTKAFDALNDYIQLVDKIRTDMSDVQRIKQRDNILYRSPQNIIAFSGQRGTGKSSVMLSFSDMLRDPKKLQDFCIQYETIKDCSNVKNKCFITLEPIDPTTMEANQSILSIVLSRMLFMAEECWSQQLNFYGKFQDKESKKTELLSAARKCLNGISTIKSKKEINNDLAELQRVGDSSILKKNLYDFVELFLQFYNMANGNEAKNCMLVIQIDDTDCQISQGYDVMEDIRKYFTIPNVLILMATDTNLLRQLLTQHYVKDFSFNLQHKLIDIEDIRQLGEKLLVKMLPPTRVVRLPYIDEIIRDKIDQLTVYYYEKDDNKDKQDNILNFCKDDSKEEYEKFNFQSVILRYIYQKTHIVFAAHDAYCNNIIPTTLRGLAHLLGLLSSMEDVPEIDFDRDTFDADYLAETIKKQTPVLEKNLNMFEQYFLHDWLLAKLPKDKAEIIKQFSEQVAEHRISFIIQKLNKYYGNKYYGNDAKEADKFLSDFINTKLFPSYVDLDWLFRTIQGTNKDKSDISFRQMEDFYFIFAVKTVLTIKNNMDVLKIKNQAVKKYYNRPASNIVFDYLQGKTSIPTGFYLEPFDLYGYTMVSRENVVNKPDVNIYKVPYYFHNNGSEDEKAKCFNFTGGIIQWLAPYESDCDAMSQLEIYKAQELAVLVAANCDVQEKIKKESIRASRRQIGFEFNYISKLSEALGEGMALMQKAVAAINEEMFEQYKLDDGEKSVWKINNEDAAYLDEKADVIKKNDKETES